MSVQFLVMAWCMAWLGAGNVRSPITVRYTLRVSVSDTTSFAVEMRVHNAPDTLHLAMAAHPEYDDRYYRFVEGLSVQSTDTVTGNVAGRVARIEREAGALWHVTGAGRDLLVRYRIHLPPPPPGMRQAWQPFIRSTGALIGGPHAFMYVVSAARWPVLVHLELPDGWQVATGLDTTTDARTFDADNAAMLVDSPMLVGRFHRWSFRAGDANHDVVYWPRPDAVAFDTTVFVHQLERLVQQTISMFGTTPYPHYTFLFQDGAYGALEHARSLTLGAPSTDLARNPSALLAQTAHEFFHTWNLVHIKPVEVPDLDYRPNAHTPSLWFSEGVTMLYADLMLRRAGLPTYDSSRVQHLEQLLERYYASPGNTALSPEQASLGEWNVRLSERGDFAASPHAQGELLGTLLDVRIRESTHGQRSLDDVMRGMMARHSGPSGFSSADLEHEFSEVCACNLAAFFAAHVRGTVPLDVNAVLRLIGLEARVSWQPALDAAGQPEHDLRVRALTESDSGALLLRVWDPGSIWERAGLHTGDTLIAVNVTPMRNRADFLPVITRAHMGDTIRLVIAQHSGQGHRTASVVMSGYRQPVVHIMPVPDASGTQLALRARWSSAMP